MAQKGEGMNWNMQWRESEDRHASTLIRGLLSLRVEAQAKELGWRDRVIGQRKMDKWVRS